MLIVDRDNRVIAASDGAGLLTERLPAFSSTQGRLAGTRRPDHRPSMSPPGYETYRGLGWRGVIETAARHRQAFGQGDTDQGAAGSDMPVGRRLL